MDKQQYEEGIKAVKQEITSLGNLHPGSLTIQTRSHGGEYHHLSFSHMGKGHTMYIRNRDVEQVKREMDNYTKFRELTDRLITLEIEYAKYRRTQTKNKNLR
ncbi:MAG: hypothetical protein KAH17_05950 [Bacteroidales bacterium]|nr:hypothetical protein [Bacteroidales bacterium]